LSFVKAMCISEQEHLKAFTHLVCSDRLLKKAIINKDWLTFAKIYNGRSYKENRYDFKMMEAYRKYAKEDD
jgi:hypothetical protein